jgi:kynureninase
VTGRADAAAIDASDPLRPFRDRFLIGDPDLVYLNGNSLGRPLASTEARLVAAIRNEWATELVRGWERWIDIAVEVGDRIAANIVGANPGEVLVADSVTVNLHKLATAAVDASPGRRVIVTDRDNFPTDRYVLEGIAGRAGATIRWVETDPVEGPDVDRIAAALDADVALVCLSHVSFKSGAVADVEDITDAAHRAGARMLWDLSHSAGALPIDLDASGADLAVGCTYKYLNGGPGAPAFLYVRADQQSQLKSSIWGWFGQRDQFAMGPTYEPAETIMRFAAGTTPVLGVLAVDEGVRMIAEAGIAALREKSIALTSLLVELADEWLAPLGFEVRSPRNPGRRGGHVALTHPDAAAISVVLRQHGVVADFRPPDSIRLAPTPLDTRFVDVWDGLDRLRALVEGGEHHRSVPAAAPRVT